MYALMLKPPHPLPTIVSMLSTEYVELSMAGYNVIDTGTRKRLEKVEEEMIVDFADLDLNENN